MRTCYLYRLPERTAKKKKKKTDPERCSIKIYILIDFNGKWLLLLVVIISRNLSVFFRFQFLRRLFQTKLFQCTSIWNQRTKGCDFNDFHHCMSSYYFGVPKRVWNHIRTTDKSVDFRYFYVAVRTLRQNFEHYWETKRILFRQKLNLTTSCNEQ